MRDIIEKKLRENLTIDFLQVINQSHKHKGHASIKGDETGETHFDIIIQAKQLQGKSRISGHRIINDLLKDQFEKGLHALSIKVR